MGRTDRFVAAGELNVKRLSLTEGDWIEVRRRLNSGEDKALDNVGQMGPAVVDGRVVFPIDWVRYEHERAMIWLLDWSFRDANDKPVPLSLSAIKALDPLDFEEVNDAIIKHMAEYNRDTAAKKASRATRTPTPTPGTSNEGQQSTS